MEYAIFYSYRGWGADEVNYDGKTSALEALKRAQDAGIDADLMVNNKLAGSTSRYYSMKLYPPFTEWDADRIGAVWREEWKADPPIESSHAE